MRIVLTTLLILSASVMVVAGNKTLEGTLVNAAGEPIEGGFITYKIYTHNNAADTMVLRSDKAGKFEMSLDGNQYNVTFSSWGYASEVWNLNSYQLADQSKIKVVLGRFDLPQTGFQLVTEASDYSWDEAQDFSKEGDAWVITVPTEQASLKYQVVVDGKRSLYGPDPAVEADRTGDLISEAKAKDGKVTIRIEPDFYQFSDDEPTKLVNVDGAGFSVFSHNLSRNNEGFKKLRELRGAEEKNLEDIAFFYEPAAAEVSTIADAKQKLLAENQLNTIFGTFTDAHNVEKAVVAAIDKDPKFLINLNPYAALGILLDKNHPDGVDEKNPPFEPEVKTLLALDAPKSFRVNVLRMGHTYADYFGKKDLAKTYMDMVLKEFPDSHAAKSLKKQAEQDAMVGQVAPDFTLTNAKGEEVSLSDYRGKYVVVDFWATWCAPCIAAMPGLAEAYALVDKEKVEFLGVCLDVKDKKLARALKKHKMTWPNLGDEGSWEAPTAKLYKLTSIPKMILVQPDGVVSAFNPRLYEGKELVEKLNEVMGVEMKASSGASSSGGER